MHGRKIITKFAAIALAIGIATPAAQAVSPARLASSEREQAAQEQVAVQRATATAQQHVAVDATTASELLHCRLSPADNHYAIYNVVANRASGCTFADAFAAMWQREEWNGNLNSSARFLNITTPAGPLTFRMQYASYPGDDPILRVQAFGTPGNSAFVSFETDQ